MRKLLDTNTWIALTVETHPQHAAAYSWYLAEPMTAGDLLFCRATETSFLRLITQVQVMKACGLVPLTNAQAVAFLESVYRDPAVSCAVEPMGMREIWLQLAGVPVASPHVWMDAYLAAFAKTAGAEFITFDHGFVRFTTDGLVLKVLEGG